MNFGSDYPTGPTSNFAGVSRLIRNLLIGSFALALFFVVGLLPIVLPWQFVVALCGAPIFAITLWLNPTVGFGFYLIALMLSPDFKLSDLMTVSAMGILAIRLFADRHLPLKLPPVLFRPFWLLIAVIVLSTLGAVLVFHNQVPFVYRDGRAFVYWLWLPLLLAMKSSGRISAPQVRTIVVMFAAAIALLALFQGASGIQVVAEGRVVVLEGTATPFGGITRVQIPGLVFVALTVVFLMIEVATEKIRWWLAGPLLLLLIAALYVNFGRALWAWTALALVFGTFLLPARRALRLSGLLAVGLAILVVALTVAKPAVLQNVVDRIVSVQSEGGRGSSFGWRRWENQDAIARIAASPLYGVGVGGEYRRWISEIRIFEDHTRYVHNAFLFYGLKLGLPGLFVLLWLLWTIWRQALNCRRKSSEKGLGAYETAVAAFIPAFVGLNMTQPEIAGPFGVLLVSIIAASLDWDQSDPVKNPLLSRVAG